MPAEQTGFNGAGGGCENPGALSSKTHTRITFNEISDDKGALERSVFVKRQCMHCLDPACVSACPVAALEVTTGNHNDAGAVVYDAERCMGCRYCMLACPFSVPTFEWDKRVPRIQKCSYCFDRLEKIQANTDINGNALEGESQGRFNESQQLPACVKVCPAGAIRIGEREELIAEGHRRIEARKNKTDSWHYVNHIYGENEVGGTSWLYLANVPFDQLGFRTDLGMQPYPMYTHAARTGVSPAVLSVGAVLGSVYWISQRRTRVEEDSSEEASEHDA
jgi:formate dehydrogenase iron-sulfur subunit